MEHMANRCQRVKADGSVTRTLRAQADYGLRCAERAPDKLPGLELAARHALDHPDPAHARHRRDLLEPGPRLPDGAVQAQRAHEEPGRIGPVGPRTERIAWLAVD